jgi:hypothetical protein
VTRDVPRSRKARRTGQVACGCWIQVGTRIIRGADGRWRCIRCVLAALMTEPPAPGRGGAP